MAKEKDRHNNSYTPIKNPELLQGQPETRSIQEIAASPKQEAKNEKETWVDNVERNKQVQPQFREKIEKYPSMKIEHDKDEPEKDH